MKVSHLKPKKLEHLKLSTSTKNATAMINLRQKTQEVLSKNVEVNVTKKKQLRKSKEPRIKYPYFAKLKIEIAKKIKLRFSSSLRD